MDQGLEGRNALVTGASKGIGLAIARALAAEGAHVVAGARSASPDLADLVDDGRVVEVHADLSTADGPADLVGAALAFGPLDVLVNNVGAVTPHLGGFLEVTEEDWSASLNLTLLAAVRTTRAVLPGMLAAGRGSIVTVSSINAFLPDPTDHRLLRGEGGADQLLEGAVEGGRAARRPRQHGQPRAGLHRPLAGGRRRRRVGRAGHGGRPRGRRARGREPRGDRQVHRPGEVADLVVMLAGERAGNVTGADLVIDGGYVDTT